jgi:hypothetical protein
MRASGGYLRPGVLLSLVPAGSGIAPYIFPIALIHCLTIA